jgi:hypothetical protein
MYRLTTHEELIAAGYNVVPVDAEKHPLAPRYAECYDRHCPELLGLFEERGVKRRQAGQALLGRINPRYPQKILVIIDIDDPPRFPQEARRIVEGTWHWLTGPRCPRDGDKHGIACASGTCRHGDHEFKLSEAVRGEAYAVLVPAEAEQLLGAGVAKLLGGAVELRVRGYQLIPPSLHPSGVLYDWITPPWAAGGLKHPKELTVEEFKTLLRLLGAGEAAVQERKPELAGECGKARELSDRDIDDILEAVKPYYVPGFRNAVLYALLGILKRKCYSEASIRGFYEKLQAWATSVYPDIDRRKDDYILEGVLRKEWRLFGWNKLKEALTQAAAQAGRSAEEVERDLARLRRILAPVEVRMKYCLEYKRGEGGIECTRYLRAKEVAEGLLIEVVSKGREFVKASKVALLPRHMAIIKDPYYAEEYYVARSGGKIIAAAPADDWDSFLNSLRQRPPYYVINKAGVVDAVKRVLPRQEAVISAGLTDNGIADPAGALDAADYGVEPLRSAYRWIRYSYSERNAKLAWFNVMAVFAKLITPLVRTARRNFVDYILYNVGRGGEGKSTLARYVLTPLLGGGEALEAYNIRVDGAVRTEPQLRNLLALNRLPLILDEQTKKALINNAGILLSAAVGLGTTGVHASRHGLGVAAKFKNLRGVIVFTNVPFSTFIREAASDSSDYALLRRFIELAWDFEPISADAFKQMVELKPALGYAARLWQKYKEELLQSANLLELIEKIVDAVVKEHPGDAVIAEMAEFTRQVAAEIRETKQAERQGLRDEDAVVERAYKFVSEELKVSQLSAIRVLRHILENPSRAGAAFSAPRSDVQERLNDVYDVIVKLKNMYAASASQDKLIEDAAVVVNILNSLAEERRVNIILLAKSPLVPGMPREVLGAQKSVFSVAGVKRAGYAVPLARFVRLFLDAEAGEEGEGW